MFTLLHFDVDAFDEGRERKKLNKIYLLKLTKSFNVI